MDFSNLGCSVSVGAYSAKHQAYTLAVSVLLEGSLYCRSRLIILCRTSKYKMKTCLTQSTSAVMTVPVLLEASLYPVLEIVFSCTVFSFQVLQC